MPQNVRHTRREFLSGRALLPTLEARDRIQFSRRAMACEFAVFLPADSSGPIAARRASTALAVLNEVERIESELSIYQEDSVISEINRQAISDWVPVDVPIYNLLETAKQLARVTAGAFDITAGPLARVWGFSQRNPKVPNPVDLQNALASLGSEHLQLDSVHNRIRFAIPTLELNLGAIGKGYALDRCSHMLDDAGEPTFLIHAGNSSIRTRTLPTSSPWKIDLRLPHAKRPRVARFLLTNHAMATSGDSVQRFSANGKTYGHILDPRTGWPASRWVTATAFSRTATEADALATAFYIMSEQEAADYCRRQGDVGALLVRPVTNDSKASTDGDATISIRRVNGYELLAIGQLPAWEAVW